MTFSYHVWVVMVTVTRVVGGSLIPIECDDSPWSLEGATVLVCIDVRVLLRPSKGKVKIRKQQRQQPS